MSDPTTRTVDAPGCTMTYDLHRETSSGTPLFLLASPMEASGFDALRAYFTDRPVITYDPRGAGRSPRTDEARDTRVAEHADDILRVIDAVGAEHARPAGDLRCPAPRVARPPDHLRKDLT